MQINEPTHINQSLEIKGMIKEIVKSPDIVGGKPLHTRLANSIEDDDVEYAIDKNTSVGFNEVVSLPNTVKSMYEGGTILNHPAPKPIANMPDEVKQGTFLDMRNSLPITYTPLINTNASNSSNASTHNVEKVFPLTPAIELPVTLNNNETFIDNSPNGILANSEEVNSSEQCSENVSSLGTPHNSAPNSSSNSTHSISNLLHKSMTFLPRIATKRRSMDDRSVINTSRNSEKEEQASGLKLPEMFRHSPKMHSEGDISSKKHSLDLSFLHYKNSHNGGHTEIENTEAKIQQEKVIFLERLKIMYKKKPTSKRTNSFISNYFTQKKELSIDDNVSIFSFEVWLRNRNYDRDFEYNIKHIAPRTDIFPDVNSDEIQNIDFLTNGSNSNIFNATWKGNNIIVKMVQMEKKDKTIVHIEFFREIQALLRINQPNIINMYGYGNLPRPFLIIEKLKDLSVMLNLTESFTFFSKQLFSYRELLFIALDIATAMDYLHDKMHPDMMIIHRDIKPENIAFNEFGHIKIIDFGLCRFVKKHENITDTYSMSNNTGTIRYMSPEVVLEKPYNEKVDVFSYAITLWAIGCNKLPYKGIDRNTYMTEIVLNGRRPKMHDSWSFEFRNLLRDCWNTDFSLRPSFQEIKYRLEILLLK